MLRTWISYRQARRPILHCHDAALFRLLCGHTLPPVGPPQSPLTINKTRPWALDSSLGHNDPLMSEYHLFSRLSVRGILYVVML
jgi:hypothetical protein